MDIQINMINHQYKTIFIHTRKCAGTSIIRSFGMTPYQLEWHAFNDGCLSTDPLNWSVVNSLYPDYLIVSIVRNPWDRFVSAWKYLRRYNKLSITNVLQNLPCSGHDYRHLTRQQSDTLFENGKPIFHYLMRYETLQNDFDAYCNMIGKPKLTLPYLNRTQNRRNRHYSEEFDDESLVMFNKIFRNDIDYFNYSFE